MKKVEPNTCFHAFVVYNKTGEKIPVCARVNRMRIRGFLQYLRTRFPSPAYSVGDVTRKNLFPSEETLILVSLDKWGKNGPKKGW